MIVALDYDDTFTHKPAAWLAVISVLKLNGYKVIGATLRNRYQPVDENFLHSCDAVVYCAGLAKDDTLADFGYAVDIWIDDKPRYIHASYEEIHGTKWLVPDDSPADLWEPLLMK